MNSQTRKVKFICTDCNGEFVSAVKYPICDGCGSLRTWPSDEVAKTNFLANVGGSDGVDLEKAS